MEQGHRTKAERDTVLQRFEQWRGVRKRGTPIPESLWEGAVGLCADDSIYRISRFLHLDYNALKKRVERTHAERTDAAVRPSSFVELEWKGSMPESEYLFEKEDPGGGRRKIHVKGRLHLEAMEFMKSFMGVER